MPIWLHRGWRSGSSWRGPKKKSAKWPASVVGRQLMGRVMRQRREKKHVYPARQTASARLILHKSRPVCNVKDDAARGPWGRVGRRARLSDGGVVARLIMRNVRVAVANTICGVALDIVSGRLRRLNSSGTRTKRRDSNLERS